MMGRWDTGDGLRVGQVQSKHLSCCTSAPLRDYYTGLCIYLKNYTHAKYMLTCIKGAKALC